MNLGPLLNAFPKKIRVSFIHATTRNLIGIYEISPSKLPISFIKPTNIELEGAYWRVMQANPIHATEFTLNNKLTLYVQETSAIDPTYIGSDIPTISNEIPALTSDSLYEGPPLKISRQQWRQIEFFHTTAIPALQEEMAEIASVLFPEKDVNTLLGYKNIYTRKYIDQIILNVSLDEVYQRINVSEIRSLYLSENNQYIENGIKIQTANHTYYGIVNKNQITVLGLKEFDSIDDEIYSLMNHYDLVLADWCNGRIIMF